MTFDEVLDCVLEMLQRRGRVSYRALKRQFDLDDAYLADLKAEIIEIHRLAVDQDGTMLVWAGAAAPPSEPLPTFLQPEPQSAPPDRHALQDGPRPAEPLAPDAERRQLTVLFCDLVDSTRLASHLDPEDYRTVVQAYQQTCAAVIQPFDGHIAQYLGDGLLVYFGYPQAHEDDAQRAVYAALGILDAMRTLGARLAQDTDVRLAVRLGIHTGLVVVGAMGGGDKQEQLALGDAPNIAARLQGLAAPDALVISEATYRLVQGYFVCQDLGAHPVRGIDQPIVIYQVLQESAAQSRLDVVVARGLTPLVGREEEMGLLLRRWAQSQDGLGQVVLLSGEAGIGKSRLVEVLRERAEHEGGPRLVFRCSPYYQQSALYPVIEHLQRRLQFRRDDTSETKLAKLEQGLQASRLPLDEVVPLLATLFAVPLPEARYTPLHLSPQRQRQKTLDVLLAWLVAEAGSKPTLTVWEDLHWADPSTLEFLSLLVDQTPTARLLTLFTCRPEFRPSWPSRSYLTHLTLGRLGDAQVGAIIERIADGKALPAEVVQQIVAKTDGVPLFVEELTKAILESGLLQEREHRYELTGPLPLLTIPATLHDSLMARLDRLATGKEVAQLAATLGRTFPYELLRAVSPLDEATLQRALARLVEAELLYQRGMLPQATYIFKHALIQEAAYQSLLKVRRQQYHQRIAQVLSEHFPDTVEAHPELLAHHYTEAGLYMQAIGYWQRAGQQAIQRSANLEAIVHLRQGLALLMMLPDTPARTQRELDFQMALGPVLMATKGYAAEETGNAYTRARELCQHVGESPQLFSVLYGLCLFYIVRAELQTARELGEQLLSLAQHQYDPAHLLVAHQALGATLFHSGEFAASRQHSEQGIALYNPQQHHTLTFVYGHNFGVVCGFYAAWALWCLGALDASLHRSHEALTLAQELSHPYSLAWCLQHAARLHYCCREVHMIHERTEALMALCTQQGFEHFAATGTILRGWVLAAQGQGEEGITHMRQGLDVSQATGTGVNRPTFLAMLAEAYGQHGQVQEGLSVLIEAQVAVDKSGEHWYEAELYRLRGELLRHADGAKRMAELTPEVCFQKAIDIARQQEAKSWELRATMSLARLWQQQGKRQEARELLAPIYGWFTEGFDTADLQEAKALLDESV
jgi:class 3 adenylate cyclase/predicted ATPase